MRIPRAGSPKDASRRRRESASRHPRSARSRPVSEAIRAIQPKPSARSPRRYFQSGSCISHCARDGVARRIVDCQAQLEAASRLRCALGFFDFLKRQFWQSIAPADNLEPYAVFTQASGFQAQVSPQEPKDAFHLGSRPTPVVGRKRVERKTCYAKRGRAFHNAAHCGHSGAMAGDAGQSTPFRPAAISIHDDGDVQPRLSVSLHINFLEPPDSRAVRGSLSLGRCCTNRFRG